MRFWRALGISVLGYYVLALAQIIIALTLHIDLLGSSLPLVFWVSATLVTIALTFGFMHWYFRAHEKYGWKQGLLFGIFFVAIGFLLDVLYVVIFGDFQAIRELFDSYIHDGGFMIQALAIVSTSIFVGHAHQRHRGKRKR